MLAPAMSGSRSPNTPEPGQETVVGAGHADKNQILVMLKILLPKAEPKSADAADALAIAITHAHHRGSAALRLRWSGHDRQAQGLIDSYGEDYVILDVAASAISALLGPHLAGAAVAGRGRGAVDRNLCPRGPDQTVRLPRDVERECSACCRRCRASAPRSRSPCSHFAPPISQRHRAARQGRGDAYAGRRSQGGRAHRHRIEGQGAGLRQCRSGAGASSGAIDDQRAPRPVTDAISALVNLGYGHPQAAAAIARPCAAPVKTPRPRS